MTDRSDQLQAARAEVQRLVADGLEHLDQFRTIGLQLQQQIAPFFQGEQIPPAIVQTAYKAFLEAGSIHENHCAQLQDSLLLLLAFSTSLLRYEEDAEH